jgi:hypothetical protein
MKPVHCSQLFAMAFFAATSASSHAETVESKSRDASATFIETQNFIVGRIGRDCLTEIGRSETPLAFQQKWQRDNAPYFDAARKYLAARLLEIENPADRDAVERGYFDSAERTGEAATAQLFSKGSKDEVCKHVMTLVDTGSMDIEQFAKATNLPIFEAVQALAKWGSTR